MSGKYKMGNGKSVYLFENVRSLLFPLLVCILFAAPLFPATLEELLGSGLAAELQSEGSLSRAQHKNPRPLLVPSSAPVRGLIDGMIREVDPSVSVETLLLYKKPAGAQSGTWTEAERTALYNKALALSTLAGIEYFSPSRNRMRVFYETSTVIDGPDTKRPLEDPRYAVPPAELRLYARQKDLSFGDNVYQYDYLAQSGALIFVQKNLTAMSYGIIPVLGKEKLRSLVAVIDAGEYLLIYAASMARAVSIPGMSQRVESSFSSRADAILSWFSQRAGGAFESARP
jgi:hypothetical protein